MSHDYSWWFSSRNLKKLWNCYCLSTFLRRCIQFDSSDSCQSQCYCLMQHTHQRDTPQPPCCCCVPYAPLLLLLCCCSAAQVQLVWLCNHWVRLHCCTLPVLLLKLLLMLSYFRVAWLGLKSSNFLCLLS